MLVKIAHTYFTYEEVNDISTIPEHSNLDTEVKVCEIKDGGIKIQSNSIRLKGMTKSLRIELQEMGYSVVQINGYHKRGKDIMIFKKEGISLDKYPEYLKQQLLDNGINFNQINGYTYIISGKDVYTCTGSARGILSYISSCLITLGYYRLTRYPRKIARPILLPHIYNFQDLLTPVYND